MCSDIEMCNLPQELRNLTAEQVDQWVRHIASKGKEARDWQRKAEAGCHRAEAQVRGKALPLSARDKRMLANATILDRIGRAAVTLQEDSEIGSDVIAMLQYDIARGVV